MADFRAYYDASWGSGLAKSVVAVVGLLATDEKWYRFERGWKRALRDYEVPYFHAWEFTASRGPFESWAYDALRRASFLDRLVKELKRDVNKAFSVVGKFADFDLVNERYRLQQPWKNIHSFCALMCVRAIEEWIRKHHPHEQVQHIIERGDPGQGAACRTAEKEKLTVAVLPKADPGTGEWVPEFQAADLMAWEYRRGYTDIFLKGKRGDALRRSFGALVQQIPHEGYEVRRDQLLSVCEADPKEFPPRVPSASINSS